MNEIVPILNENVLKVFDSYPKSVRPVMLKIREIILDTAKNISAVGPIEETLKWGEPSYLTTKTKSGTTVRIHWKSNNPDYYGIYFNCKTTLVDTIKEIYGDIFVYQGNRCILLPVKGIIPIKELSDCIAMALTYHLSKKRR